MGRIEYLQLIQGYLEGEFTVDQLKEQYFRAFKSESTALPHPLFLILEDFFEDLDAYSPLWSEADESPFRLTEPSLRAEAIAARDQLRAYGANV